MQPTDANPAPGAVLPRVYEANDGHCYVRLNQHVRYSVSNAQTQRSKEDSLVDRGANGGFAGDDVCVLDHTFKTANVTGIEDHTVQGLPIGTVAGLVETHKGKAVVILHQYAIYGKGKTFHSSAQLEFHGNEVCNKSRKVGGKQRITTLDGYVIPLQVRDG